MLHLSFEDEQHVEVAGNISHFDISSETDSHVRHEDHSLLVIRVLKNGVTFDLPDQSDCDYGDGSSLRIHGRATHSLG